MSLVVRSESSNTPALPADVQANQQIVQTLAWAQAAEAVYAVAEKLVSTSFVPAAYRNKPMEATAAILAGMEVGLSQMASLRAFDNIQGTPAPKAITLRAIVQGQGHEIIVKESTARVAVVAGRRRGDTEWQTSRWDIPRAQQMGLLGKDQWKNQPTAMLIARATSECCRLVAADAIMGMPYSAEEILDQDAEVREAPRRVSLDDIDNADDERPEAPQIAERPVSAPPVNAEPMTKAQQGKMFALFAEKGLNSSAQQREFVAEKIGRQIASRNDLTKDEAKVVIDALEALAMPAPAESAADVDMGGAELDDPIEGELQ